MNDTRWAWPIAESLHFIGLCLLFGIIGLFDLRLIGFLKRLPLAALHRLIPWGILGYGINVLTGLTFISGFPDQYIHNPAFQTKILFMTTAGLNVVVFYLATYRHILDVGSGQDAPRRARIAGAVSLLCWTGVIVCGRFITFFRPPFHWCFWC
jgi:hypothetical protein